MITGGVGMRCLGRLLRGVGSDTGSSSSSKLFIYYHLELYHHAVSQGVSLYHCITLRRVIQLDTDRPYTHNIPPVGIETGTIRRWKYIRKANGVFHSDTATVSNVPQCNEGLC